MVAAPRANNLAPANTALPPVTRAGNSVNSGTAAPLGLIGIDGTNLTKVTGDLSGWKGKNAADNIQRLKGYHRQQQRSGHLRLAQADYGAGSCGCSDRIPAGHRYKREWREYGSQPDNCRHSSSRYHPDHRYPRRPHGPESAAQGPERVQDRRRLEDRSHPHEQPEARTGRGQIVSR